MNPILIASIIVGSAAIVLSLLSLGIAIVQHRRIKEAETEENRAYHPFEERQVNDIIIDELGFLKVSDWSYFYDFLRKKGEKEHPVFCEKLSDFCFARCPHFGKAVYFKYDKESPVFRCEYLPIQYDGKKFEDRRILTVETEEKEPEYFLHPVESEVQE